MSNVPDYRFFLGGHDLEMVEIARLLDEAGYGARARDAGLAWGARASAYADEIEASLARGETPTLIELEDDLAPSIARSRLMIIDHHGARAGLEKPSSIEQIYALVGRDAKVPWTRWRALVAANDKGHASAMRAMGASAEEIRQIRDADRAAQGVAPEWEEESRRALACARKIGALLVVETAAPTSSAVADFLLPEYGGPGECDALVATSKTFAFFGDGRAIAQLANVPHCWFGGALPQRGFWGAPKSAASLDALIARIGAVLAPSKS